MEDTHVKERVSRGEVDDVHSLSQELTQEKKNVIESKIEDEMSQEGHSGSLLHKIGLCFSGVFVGRITKIKRLEHREDVRLHLRTKLGKEKQVRVDNSESWGEKNEFVRLLHWKNVSEESIEDLYGKKVLVGRYTNTEKLLIPQNMDNFSKILHYTNLFHRFIGATPRNIKWSGVKNRSYIGKAMNSILLPSIVLLFSTILVKMAATSSASLLTPLNVAGGVLLYVLIAAFIRFQLVLYRIFNSFEMSDTLISKYV